MKMRVTMVSSAVFAGLLMINFAGQSEPETRLSVRLTPTDWTVNEAGILKLEVDVLEGNIREGGRIALQVPGSWILHAFHPEERDGRTVAYQGYSRLTEELPDYVEVAGGGSDWELQVVEEDADGSYHRFGRRFVFTRVSGVLETGSRFTIHYGTEARPIHASPLAETVSFQALWDPGDGEWSPVAPAIPISTRPEAAERLLVTAPSQGVVGQSIRLHITARDRFGNPATLPRELRVRQTGSTAEGVEASLPGDEAYFTEFATPLEETGFQSFEAGTESIGFHSSNPVLVTRSEPVLRLFWGDLHSHSSVSKDGIGSDSFRFARDYSNLDFFAPTEHSTGDREDNGITGVEWDSIQEAVQSFYEPGRFVTLLAYECSLPHPYGHQNVYFAEDRGPLYRKHEVKTLEELWRRLANHRAFTVPHHTGIVFGGAGPGASVVWGNSDHPMRPLLEIYSGHGQSELYDPSSPLSYDNMIFDQRWKEWFPRYAPSTPEKYREMVGPHSHDGPNYARDAWAAGLHLGVISSSDDHTARPGQASKGLAAVWAEKLDRESIFEALRKKQTYGTTGQRIFLDFRINGSGPGSEITSTGPPRIDLIVYGTRPLDRVELVRFNRGGRDYSVAREWSPEGLKLETSITDDATQGEGFYYVRVLQKGLIEGRPAMAWSSPIWVSWK